MKTFTTRKFHTGDKVKTVSFDGWGSNQILTVISEKTISPEISSVPHHRIKATAPNGESYEGAERNFIKVI
jgi:hypothetical protein